MLWIDSSEVTAFMVPVYNKQVYKTEQAYKAKTVISDNDKCRVDNKTVMW